MAWYCNEEGQKYHKDGRFLSAIKCYDEAIKLDSKYKQAWNNKGKSLFNLEQYNASIQCFDEAIKIEPRYKEAWLNKGITLETIGKINEALQCFDEALKIDSRYKDALFIKGKVLDKLGRFLESIQTYDEIFKIDLQFKDAWFNKGIALHNLTKYEEAIECFDQVIKLDAESKLGWFNKGFSLHNLGKFEEAIECYDQVIRLDPNYKNAWNNMGFSLHSLGRFSEAIECYDEAIRLDKKYKLAWNNKGNSLNSLGNYRDAIRCYEEALVLDSKYKLACYNKGNTLYNLGRYDDASNCFADVIRLDPKNKLAWNNKGISLHNLGKYSEAVQAFDEAIKLDSNYKLAWNNKGLSLYHLGRFAEAIQSFEEATKLDPDFKEAWTKMGLCYDELGKYEEGMHCFEEVIALEPTDKDAWNNKGYTLDKLGRYSEAIECYEEVIKLDPTHKLAWNNKGYSLYCLKKYNEAIECYDEVLELDPQYKLAWNNKGLSLANLGKYNAATQCFDEVIKLDSKHFNALRNKACSLIKLGLLDESLACLNKAIEFNPTYKEALNDKGRINKKQADYENAIKWFDEALKIDPTYEDPKLNKNRINILKHTSSKAYFEKSLEDLKSNKIIQLDLGDMEIGNKECRDLSEILKVNYSLQELNLEDNNIGNHGIKCLNKALAVNYSLQILKLKDNFFDNLTLFREIENKLEENKNSLTLKNLKIDWNQILLKKFELKTLIINKCNLTHIPFEINELEGLINLDLQDNQLTDLPNISKLTKLITLNLSKNKLRLEIKENDIYNELYTILHLNFPKSIKKVMLKENEGLVGLVSLINIILIKDVLESEIESLSEIFFWIYFLNKVDISIEKLLAKAKTLKELSIFDLSSSEFSVIPKHLPMFKLEDYCTQLLLMNNKFNEVPEPIFSLTNLKILRLQNNHIASIPQSVSKLKYLFEISIEDNELYEFPSYLSKIKTIHRLWIDKNKLKSVPRHLDFTNLQRFSISQNNLTDFGGIIEWNKLQILILSENNIEEIPEEIKNLTQLKKLYLNKNKIRMIPFQIGELKELTDLQAQDNLIEDIPLSIGELVQLEIIDFANNHIKIVPPSMGLLHKLEYLNLKGNPIISPPIEIANNLNDLKGYWNDLLLGEQKCNFLKLIIVGEENVGKTTLVRTLNAYNNALFFPSWKVEEEFKNKPLSTDGIDISIRPFILDIEKTHGLPNNKLILNIWDFGGQEIYHSTHIFFLSPNSIYLIVWDMSKKEDEINRLSYWIQTIQTYIKSPMIILVGTHLDYLDLKTGKPIEEIYENISAKSGISKEFIIGVSCKNGKNYDKLIQLIKNKSLYEEDRENKAPIYNVNKTKILKSMVGQIFPKMYFNLKKTIEEEGKNRIQNKIPPILEWNDFKLIAEKSNIVREEELKRGLFFLHCLGFCLYFSKDKVLSKYVILNSQWLADTMATLITTKGQFIQSGLLDHQHFKHAWREPKYPSKIHPILFDLLQKFHVLIPITHDIEGDIYSGKSVVPALLSNENKPLYVINSWNEGSKIEIQRIYQFTSFLPSQIFPQFMATIFSLFGLKDIQYWRDGILIKKEKIKCLIELDILNKTIIISFIGKNFIYLFKQIQIRLEMVLNKWENLPLEIYITCSLCASSPESHGNKCFKLRECFEYYSNQIGYVICRFSACDETNEKRIKLKKLIPELHLSQIKKLVEWNEVKIKDKIGEGSFAEVYKGLYESNLVAIKKFKISKLNSFEFPPELNNDFLIIEETIRGFLLEIGFLSYGNHNNLLQLIGIILSPPSIILPFADYGSLFNLIHKIKDADIMSSFELSLRVALDIMLGVNYLHSLNPPIIHCDLKSENVLIMTTDFQDENCVCKISDFGLSQFSVGRFLINKNINPIWTAPEVLDKKDQSIYSDIYSFGMILYELLTKRIPYCEQNPEWNFMHNIEKSIIEGVRPIYSKKNIETQFKTQLPKQIYEIMELCWSNVPKNRPNSKSIIKLFYSLLSDYWNEIENYIALPFSLKEVSDYFIEFKNEASIQKIEEISKGAYAIVSSCKIKELSEGKEFIIKELRKDIPEKHKQSFRDFFQIKVDILKAVNSIASHPNIIQLIGYYHNLNEDRFWIILENCNGGSLEHHLNLTNRNHNLAFPLPDLIRLFKDILFGLKHLHENGYAHLDLKPDHILIKQENGIVLNLCLCNFGSNKPQTKIKSKNELEGSYNYMAPEIYYNEENSSYDVHKADIWSLGYVLFRMLGETFPYNGPFRESLSLSLFLDSNFNSVDPLPGIYLICTQLDPIYRPSINQILDYF